MKTFLTLLATIISLSAYTLVGVRAKCPICPGSVAGTALGNQCTFNGITACQYPNDHVGAVRNPIYCYYNENGSLDKDSNYCPKTVNTNNNACPACH
ncbi:hypothetical protein PAXRUDRAFT_836488 [Paxillus rubicundulus Ve08.2h10]|uniref:Secreted protein n=1 Tax=Paxillus rubicundulus Ve08.2h10 TaxID=930991 RepID=A0A0D0D609_9AGAM|nr:hypothetical protein PAXRUDRAFT_836488 [Paxillus rubicundulus Ve08.2h10]